MIALFTLEPLDKWVPPHTCVSMQASNTTPCIKSPQMPMCVAPTEFTPPREDLTHRQTEASQEAELWGAPPPGPHFWAEGKPCLVGGLDAVSPEQGSL